MKEIQSLNVKRTELQKNHYYYNGCSCSEMSEQSEPNEEILNLVADVLIQILMKEKKEDV